MDQVARYSLQESIKIVEAYFAMESTSKLKTIPETQRPYLMQAEALRPDSH